MLRWSQIEPKNIFFYIFAQKYIFFNFCQKCSYFHPNLLFLAGPPRRWCGWKRLQRRAPKRWREAKLYHRGSLGGGVRGPVRVRGAELRRGQSQAAIKDLLRRKVRVSFRLPKRIKFLLCVCTLSQSVRPSGYLGSREIINYPRPTQQKQPLYT